MRIFKKPHHDFTGPPELRCSFCGKEQHRVKRLIAGPTVYICNECVTICDQIVADSETSDRKLLRESGICSFCQTILPAARMLTVPERGQLCPDCLEATRSAIDAFARS